MHKSLLFMALVCVSVFLGGCQKGGAEKIQSAVDGVVRSSDKRANHLTIVSFNDYHGTLYEIPLKDKAGMAIGGLPWMVSAVRHIADQEKDRVLILDAGDIFQGSSAVNASKGMGSVEAMKLLGIDASSVGNHEFDYGAVEGYDDPLRGSLLRAMDAASFHWLSANVVKGVGDEKSVWPPAKLKPWVVIERGGYRVGVIGLTTRDTVTTTVPERVRDLVFEDVREVLKRELPKVEAEGVDFIVVLGHLSGTCVLPGKSEGESCSFDGEIGEILDMPDEFLSKIGLLVTGHSHKNIVEQQRGIWVLQNRAQSREINKTRLVLGSDGKLRVEGKPETWVLEHKSVDPGCDGQPFPMDAIDVGGVQLKPSVEALSLIEKLEKANPNPSCEILGCAEAPLTRGRSGESELGNMVSDIMRGAFKDAEVGLQNSGGLRSDFLKQDLRREDVESLMPFENFAYLVEMTGEELWRTLLVSSTGKHGVILVSGLSYTMARGCKNPYDVNGDGEIESWENDCLCEVKIGDKLLDKKKSYKVSLNSFMFDGGDSLKGIYRQSKLLEKGPVIKQIIVNYIKGKKNVCIKASDYYQEDKPRVKIVDKCQ